MPRALRRLWGSRSRASSPTRAISWRRSPSCCSTRFQTGTAPDGTPWAPKSSTTITAYEARKEPVSLKPLIGPTKSLSSVTNFATASGADWVRISSRAVQSAVMQFGAPQGAFGAFMGIDERGRAMRGVGFIVAVTVVAEVGDFGRFGTPRQLMAYLGLTPSEHSSGASVRRGGITKAGSGLARRALAEGAWSDRMQARVSLKLLARLEALPQAVRDIAWKGQLRMCQRYRHLVAAGKAKVVVITAIAREMAGFIWAIARATTPVPGGEARAQG